MLIHIQTFKESSEFRLEKPSAGTPKKDSQHYTPGSHRTPARQFVGNGRDTYLSRPFSGSSARHSTGANNTWVFVTGMSSPMPIADLQQVFRSCGLIESIQITGRSRPGGKHQSSCLMCY